MTPTDLTGERRLAITLAREVGDLLHHERSGARRIAFKGSPTNLVTEMDARAEAIIVDRLAAAFPDDAILAEERGARAGRSGRRWIIDPLDGTTNYAHGLPIFGVSIGLEAAGRVVLGVVYDPSRARCSWPSAGAAPTATTPASPSRPPRRWTRASWPPASPTTSASSRQQPQGVRRVQRARARRAPPGLGGALPAVGGRRPARRLLGAAARRVGRRRRRPDGRGGRRPRHRDRRRSARSRRAHRRRQQRARSTIRS